MKLTKDQEIREHMKAFILGLDAFFRTSTDDEEDVSLKAQMNQQKKTFNRQAYYSQTEACAKYEISREIFNQLCIRNGIHQVRKTIPMGGYKVETRYVLKEEFDKIIFV